MDLDRSLLKEFAKVVNDVGDKPEPKQYVHGTITTGAGNTKCVMLDGSDMLTPISEVVNAEAGDRVLVSVSNHQATVIGNITFPPSARKEDQAIESANGALEQSNQAMEKAKDAQTKASSAITDSSVASALANEAKTESAKAQEAANTAIQNADKAKQLAQASNNKSDETQQLANQVKDSVTAANKDIGKLKTEVKTANDNIASANTKLDTQAGEIATIKETYSTKVETESTKADLTTEINKKVGELQTTVEKNFSTKTENVALEKKLQTQITQNANSISSTVTKVEKLESDTTEQQKNIDKALQDAQAANTAAGVAKSDAEKAKTAADTAQKAADDATAKAESATTAANLAEQKVTAADKQLQQAKTDLAEAQENLKNVTTRVGATEQEITEAKQKVDTANANVTKALTDVAEAKNAASKANEAASKAQGEATAANKAASDAQTKAADAQKVATNAQQAADKAQSDLAALTNRVTTAETKITQTNEAITAQASKINETSNKIDGIQNDITNNYYSKEQTDAQIKVSADKISQTVSETNKVVTSANKNATDALNKANSLTDRANSGEFDGRGVASTKVEYQASTSGTAVPTGTWSTTIPSVAADKPYLWTRTVITYSDNTQSTSYSVGSTPEGIQVGGRNLIKYGKGDSKNGIFKNFTRIKDGYAEFTLKSKKTYALINIGEGFVLGCREYKVGAVYIWSYDIMFTEWNFPSGTNRNEFWFGQRYTNAPSGQTGTGQWTKVTAHNLPEVGSNGCKLNEWYHVEQKIIIPAKASANVGTAASIQFYNSNANVEASFTARFKNVKLELGNKATDWTPAPEDQEQYVDDKIAASEKTTEESYKALINQTAQEISLLVQSVKSTADSNSSSISTIASNLKVTSDGLNATKTSINTLTNAVNGTVSKQELQQYLRWNGGDLELGNSIQPFRCKLSNTELAFYQNEDKVAWISNKELYILKAVIAQSIGCGNFMFVDEGDLGFSLI